MTLSKKFSESLNSDTKRYGDHKNNISQVECRAGNLKMLYERGCLRYISIGENELIRMIYSAVRIKDWITVIPVISNEKIEIMPDSFNITYKASYISEEINFSSYYKISGNSDTSLTFEFEGEALIDFERNRIGFCVLHPIEDNMGEDCSICHSNGIVEELIFPYEISPHQPFLDIRSMSWIRKKTGCTLEFSGDIFETEDQRNWTDASYKTYCTPLSKQYPVTIKKEQKLSQKIFFRAESNYHIASNDFDRIKISIDRMKSVPFPALGIGQSSRLNPITLDEIDLIRKIKFDHYRADIFLFSEHWKSQAERAFRESSLLGFRIELALFVDDNYSEQIHKLIDFTISEINNIAVFILYHKTAKVIPDQLLEQIIPPLNEAFPQADVCCGTNANFAQLNRNRPESLIYDSISYSIHPQEHASDNLTLVENLQAQAYTVQSALRFNGNKKIRISPLNIQRRFNANSTNFEIISKDTSVPPQVDSRLMSLFGGLWLTGSIKYLGESGASSVTLLETVGERGIVQGDYDSRWPADFQSVKGMIFPVYTVLKYILLNKQFKILQSKSSHPLKVDSFAFYNGNVLKIVLLNFTSVQQQIFLEPVLKEASIRILNDQTYPEAVSDDDWLDKAEIKKVQDAGQLSLDPFSITFIEG